MKVGILCRDFNLLKNWELRILNKMINNPLYSISLIIKDGRKHNSREKITRFLNSKNKIGKICLYFQSIIERKLFPEMELVDKEKIISFLKQVKYINLYPARNRNIDIFSQEDSELIKTHGLDVILKHGFNIINGDIENSAKYGIWCLNHSDYSINCSEPIGFWETIHNQPVITVTLQRLCSKPDRQIVIDKGFYSRNLSFIESSRRAYENSSNLLFKNLKVLDTYGSFKHNSTEVCYNQKNCVPTVKNIFNYIFQFHGFYIQKKLNKITKLGLRPNCWALFSSSGNIFGSILLKSQMIRPGKKEFWADPFTFKYNNITYLFFENFDYKHQRGKISCGILENNQISQIKDVLKCNYHLSYPFIIRLNNDIFMIPETHENKRLEIYKSIDFPLKWELYSTGFNGESISDATIYSDSNNDIWLFINKGTPPLYDFNCELYIYKIDSIELNKIIPHKNNPVIIDSRRARNGGAIFKDGDNVIRPSQNNSFGIYGYGLNLSVIKKLTLDEYEEELLTTIEPNFLDGMKAIHHLCQTEEGFVFDGCFSFL